MEKQDTIAKTMATLMATSPAIAIYPTYKALNDAVGVVHGLPNGKVQALAGLKAWAWTADATTGTWRKATDDEVQARVDKAATKCHGVRGSKVMSEADRAALDTQVTALEAVNNPALLPLLNGLKAQQVGDDAAKKGSLKERLQAAVGKLGMGEAVAYLEGIIAEEVVAEEVVAEDIPFDVATA